MKDYGVIGELEGFATVTGLIVNENLASNKTEVEVGSKIIARVMDIDY